jgi:hypothetical protein
MWATDMANRTVDTDWNIYSHQEWMNGWQQMMIPGTYERGIFGDLMLPGVTCGIRKILLIFNTNPESAHDPIYVMHPRQFNVQADTSVPIILAYNQSHYESLHPCSNKDILASINLVKEYLEGRYRFGKKDFPFLLHLDDEGPSELQVQGACAPLLKTNLKKDDHKPGNVKEMVAPSPKKTAQFDQTSQNKKEPSTAQLKRRSKPARTNLAKPKETFNEDNEFQGTQGPNRKRSAKSQSESTILDTEMEANNGKGDTAEDVNLAEVDEYFNTFIKNNEGISCPSSPQAPLSKKTKKKAKNRPSSAPNPTSNFHGKQNGIDNEDANSNICR